MAGQQIRRDRTFDLDGYWWVPDQTEPCVGQLTYGPESGARLCVTGWFSREKRLRAAAVDPFGLFEPERLEVIHGETLDGTACTIFDALGAGSFTAAHSQTTWSSNSLFVGVHLTSREELRFNTVRLELRGLRQWLTRPMDTPRGRVKGLDGRTEESAVSVELRDADLSLSVAPMETRDEFGDEYHRVRTAFARVSTSETVSLSEFVDRWLTPLRELLVLGTREAVTIDQLTILLPSPDEELPSPPFQQGRRRPPTVDAIEVVERVRTFPPNDNHKSYNHMLFGLATVHEAPEQFLANWFDVRARLGDAGGLFFATLDGPPSYLENNLLNYLAFAEAYHRIEHDAVPLPEDLHKELQVRMLNVLDTREQRDVYASSLQYANSMTQRKRIRALFRRAADAMPALEAWTKRLPDSLIDTRNYLTHWTSKGANVLDPNGPLHDGVRRLVVVLQVNLLLDLELPSDVIAACIRGSYGGQSVLPPTT